MEEKTLEEIYDYTDTIIAIAFNRTDIPGFTDVEGMMDKVELFKGAYYFDTWIGDKEIRKLFTLGFFQEQIKLFNEAVKDYTKEDNRERLKYYYLSAHDDNIAMWGTAYGIPQERIPPFAAEMVFELRKKDDNKYYVSLQLDGKDIELQGGCKGATQCELNTYINYLQKDLMEGLEPGSNDVNEMCNSLGGFETEVITEAPIQSSTTDFLTSEDFLMGMLWFFVGSAIFGVMLAICLGLRKTKVQEMKSKGGDNYDQLVNTSTPVEDQV